MPARHAAADPNSRPLPQSTLRRAAFEALEQRRLLAYAGGAFELPILYDFAFEKNGVEDAGGENTGFPIVQGNATGTELDSDLIDLDRDASVLRLSTAGDVGQGTNFGTTNSLVNGLQLPFDGSEDWLVHTRVGLAGDTLDGFAEGFEQAGLLVGPSQDRYVKLVFGHDGTGNVVQFLAENTDGSGDIVYPLGESGVTSDPTGVEGVDLATASFVDLWLAGDASTGEIAAQYRVDGGATVRLGTAYDAPSSYFREDFTRAGLVAIQRNAGDPITAEFELFEVTRDDLPGLNPAVAEVRPGDGAADVNRGDFVAVDLYLPNASVRGSTLEAGNVRLVRVADSLEVDGRINTSGGGDAIVFTPNRALDADTEYRFEITDGVTDLLGVPFEPFESTFTTGFVLGTDNDLGSVAFEQIELPETVGTVWSGVTVGPDGRLYGVAVTGEIFRYDIEGDGTLSNETEITTLNDAEGEQRLATGLVFAPDATASNLVAYVTHTQLNTLSTNIPSDLGEDFTGKITRLSGANLQNATLLVEGLPRSTRDHLTNQPQFGPDGRLYFVQGANTAMGAPDAAWGFRPERELSGAVVAVDVDQIEADGSPVDVQTAEGGTYDPDAAGVPVTVYAEGLRNAYDLVFHSNGRLYVPANGSAAGGNTPADPDGSTPALSGVSETQPDFLFDVVEGGYYGHPNPTRGYYALNGANPTSGDDLAQVSDYPVGIFPEADYQGFAYDFGLNQSPNGAIEYVGGAFNGVLDEYLVVTRFAGSDDLIFLEFGEDGEVIDAVTSLPGTEGFQNPLDVAQGPGGVLYVAQFGDREGEVAVPDPNSRRITLLRPVAAGGEASVERRRVLVDAAPGEGEVRPFVVRNDGDEPLILSPYTLGITGPDKNLFEYVNPPSNAVTVEPGGAFAFEVRFNAPAGAAVGDTFEAIAFVRTSDADAPEVGSRLVGFVRAGVEGTNEPSLQRIFDVYDLGITTGDPDPSTVAINVDELGGLDAQLFAPADPSRPVAVEPIASYSPPNDPSFTFGTYSPGKPDTYRPLGTVETAQGLDPITVAPDKFFASGPFGLYVQSPQFLDDLGPGISDDVGRIAYSEDALNTWENVAEERDKVAVYEIPGVPDALAVAFEEFTGATDYNDAVFVMRNVRAVDPAPGRLVAVEGATDGGLDRLVFSEINPANRDDRFGTQFVRNSRSVDLVNTGGATLTITGVTTPAGFAANVDGSTTLAAGQLTELDILFNATSEGPNEGFYEGDIVVNVAGGEDFVLPVSGYYMPYSEDDVASGTQKLNEEPSLNEMIAVFGLDVDVGTDAQRQTGTPDAVGDEVLSPFWRAAETDLPVEVYQLAAFHNTNTSDQISWFPETLDEATANATSQLIFRHGNTSAQTFIPAIDGGTAPAAGTFQPGTQTFGFRVVNEYSVDDFNDDSTNPGDPNAEDLHLFRFFPLIDAGGNQVEDAWLIAMDFTGFNFDYNDNIYVVRNIEPANQPSQPAGVTATPVVGGNATVYFGVPVDARVGLFRSDDGGGSFTQVATAGRQGFFEVSSADDDTVLRVATLTTAGQPGTFSEVALG